MCGYYYHLMLLMLLQSAQSEVECYGLCIDMKETPSLSCVTVPCPHNLLEDCGEVRDSDQCYAAPIMPEDESLRGCNVLSIETEEEEEDRVRLIGFGVLLLFVMLMIAIAVSRQ